MRVLWTNEAVTAIEEIVEYIVADNPSAAHALAEQIFDTVERQLPDHPLSGRPGRVDGTRELIVHRSYIVAYRVIGTKIEILTVRHAARRWPNSF